MLKVKITFTPTVSSGNVVFRLRYKGFSSAELNSVTGTTSALETIPVVTANAVQTYTTTINVPTSEFAGFVSNVWAVNREYLNIILERVGANAGDTNTGSIQIMSVALVQ